jgi:hypothetical protein
VPHFKLTTFVAMCVFLLGCHFAQSLFVGGGGGGGGHYRLSAFVHLFQICSRIRVTLYLLDISDFVRMNHRLMYFFPLF